MCSLAISLLNCYYWVTFALSYMNSNVTRNDDDDDGGGNDDDNDRKEGKSQ